MEEINKYTIPTIRSVATILSILTMVIAFSLAVSASLLVIDRRDLEEAIRQRTTEIYNSLYSSTTLLTAGVLEIYCMFSWVSASSIEKDFSEPIVITSVITSGLFFTLMLVVIYIPLGSSPDRVGKVNKIVKGPHDWIVRHSSW